MLDCYISERTCEVKLYRSWCVVAVVICRIVKIASVEVAWMACWRCTCELKLSRSWFVVAFVICRIVKIASVEVAWIAS